MRIAKVIGKLTLGRRLPELASGSLLLAEAIDGPGIRMEMKAMKRTSVEAQTLVVLDELGAGMGQFIAVSEGREAAMPFDLRQVPIDAYNAAILDQLEVTQ